MTLHPSGLYDALYVVGYLNSIIIDQLDAGTFTNDFSSYCSMTESEFGVRMREKEVDCIHQMYIFLEIKYRI